MLLLACFLFRVCAFDFFRTLAVAHVIESHARLALQAHVGTRIRMARRLSISASAYCVRQCTAVREDPIVAAARPLAGVL